MTEITEIKGVGPATAKVFAKGGFSTVSDIARATVADLAAIPGVGELRASSLIGAARALQGEASSSGSGNGLDAASEPMKKNSKKKEKKKGGKKKKSSKKLSAKKDKTKDSKKGKSGKSENKREKDKKKKSKKK